MRWTEPVPLLALEIAMVTLACGPGHANDARESDPLIEGLSPRAKCYVSALDARDDPRTRCMADCIRSGEGINVGGGCWHRCYAYQAPEVPPHSTFDHCPSNPALEPGPPTEIVCESTTSEVAFSGNVFGDVEDESVAYAYISFWPPGLAPDGSEEQWGKIFDRNIRPIETRTDSTGRFVIADLPLGDLEVYIRATGYLSPPNDTVRIRSGEMCTMTVPLESYVEEGF